MTTAIITGASGGIGRELARLFARDGYDVALVARNEPTLKGLADELVKRHGIHAWPLVADLGRSAGPVAVADAVKAAGAEVSVLVNNAGFGLHGRFAQTSLERELEMIRVNVAALTHLTKLFLPGMLARRSGRIVNVASTAALQVRRAGGRQWRCGARPVPGAGHRSAGRGVRFPRVAGPDRHRRHRGERVAAADGQLW